MSSQHHSPAVVGAALAAIVLGSTMLGAAAASPSAAPAAQPGSGLAAKKKASKGILKVAMTGTGTYSVTGKGFRKTASASKSFKVKPGSYTVKAPSGTVKPGTVKVHKGKTARVTVTFQTTPAPSDATPLPVQAQPPATPSPTPTEPPTPTPDPVPVGARGPVQRISTDINGAEADDRTTSGGVWSPDGTRIAFTSAASNLISNDPDTHGYDDIFVKTLATGAVTVVSVKQDGTPANEHSSSPAWSPDGTRIAFSSRATNLDPRTSSTGGIFVKNLNTGAVEEVSTRQDGTAADYGYSYSPVWSPDGTRIAFSSEAMNLTSGMDYSNGSDVFVKTLATGALQRISTDASDTAANGWSYSSAWSPDGTRIAFFSNASNLVPGDTNGCADVFVKTLATGAVQRISTAQDNSQANGAADAPKWSADGGRLAFSSIADNLVAGDANGVQDLFVKTLATGAVQRISVAGDGTEANNASSGGPSPWAPDGNHIAFSSAATNLVPGDTNNTTDVFVKNLTSGAVQLISAADDGTQANIGDDPNPPAYSQGSHAPAWSPDGTKVTLWSYASNLVTNDTNDNADLFVKTLP